MSKQYIGKIPPQVRLGIAVEFLKDYEEGYQNIDVLIDHYVNVYYVDMDKELLREFLYDLSDIAT